MIAFVCVARDARGIDWLIEVKFYLKPHGCNNKTYKCKIAV